MLTVKIHNKVNADPPPRCDYHVEVRIGSEALWIGDVTGHLRSDGWLSLLEEAVEAMKGDSK
jgi:hypothetical protein